jgi:hypothetical protein
MRTWRLIALDHREHWEAALATIPHGLAHTWGYNWAVQTTSGHRTALFEMVDGDNHFVCPIAERSFAGTVDVHTPLGFGGFVGHGDVTLLMEAWQACARERDYVAGYLGLHPVLSPRELVSHPDARSRNSAYILDLSGGESVRLGHMSRSTRRNLSRHQEDLELETDRTVLTEAFVRLYHPFMAERGAASVYALRIETLRLLCGLRGVALAGAPAGGVGAVVMTGSTGSGADYLFGVADKASRASILPLLWQLVREHSAHGEPWLNLGGGIREGDTLADFKRRLGGQRRAYVTLNQIYRPRAYAQLLDEHGSAASETYFPAYLAPSASPSKLSR